MSDPALVVCALIHGCGDVEVGCGDRVVVLIPDSRGRVSRFRAGWSHVEAHTFSFPVLDHDLMGGDGCLVFLAGCEPSDFSEVLLVPVERGGIDG